MRQTEGLLVFFDEEQRNELLKAGQDAGIESFTDALTIPDLAIRTSRVAALSFSETTLDFLSLVTKGKQVVTSKSRVEFSELLDIGEISFNEINFRLKENLHQYFVRSSSGRGKRIPQKTWEQLINIIKILRPQLAGDIDRLETLGLYSGFHLTGDDADYLLQQREALGTALDIFSGSSKLRSQVLRGWAPPTDSITNINEKDRNGNLVTTTNQSRNFLAGLPSRFIQEESALQHDLSNWPSAIAKMEAGYCQFSLGDRRLDVIYANRNQLESKLGVDLIYYNENFSSFVLVQYKLMRKEDDKFVFRPDSQLDDELQRIDKFMENYPPDSSFSDHTGYRLNSDGFFIKLVPNQGLRPASGDLIAGMYLTREYVQFITGPHATTGPRKGRVITFDSAPRYLPNTDFAKLVEYGFIGTRGSQSKVLEDLITSFMIDGKTMIIAHERTVDQKHQDKETHGDQQHSVSIFDSA